MSTKIALNAEMRSDLGKGASRRLRRSVDKVPAIIYGDNKDPVAISIQHKDIHKAQTNEAFFASVLSINLDGKEVPAIIKDMQRHPARDIILHADFLRIDPNKKINIHVPLHFINQEQCKGVKEGGVISHSSTDMEISCLPSNLPEYIEVDMLEVELDQIVHLSDITLPEGIISIALSHGADHDLAIAQVHIRKGGDIEEEEAAAAAGDEETPKEDGEATPNEE